MKQQKQIEARLLREQGISVRNIAKILNVSRSSISIWVRDVELTEKQKAILGQRSGDKFQKATEVRLDKQRKQREQWVEQGRKLAAEDDVFRILAAVYWGEGTKHPNRFKVANTDPNMISFTWKWLCKHGYKDRVSFSVTYHVDNGLGEEEIAEWWMSYLPGVEIDNIKKFTVKSTVGVKVKKIGKQPYGVGYLWVYSTELRQMIEGGIQHIMSL